VLCFREKTVHNRELCCAVLQGNGSTDPRAVLCCAVLQGKDSTDPRAAGSSARSSKMEGSSTEHKMRILYTVITTGTGQNRTKQKQKEKEKRTLSHFQHPAQTPSAHSHQALGSRVLAFLT
jgi:hypothetical protein